jgi:hypothetical protein
MARITGMSSEPIWAEDIYPPVPDSVLPHLTPQQTREMIEHNLAQMDAQPPEKSVEEGMAWLRARYSWSTD